jgi:hypothetical protein
MLSKRGGLTKPAYLAQHDSFELAEQAQLDYYYNALKSNLAFKDKAAQALSAMEGVDGANPMDGESGEAALDNFKLNFKDAPPTWSEVNKGTKIDYRHVELDKVLEELS